MKVLCGTDSYGKEFKAKKYKLDKHFLTKVTRQNGKRNSKLDPGFHFFFIKSISNIPSSCHLHLPDLIFLRLFHDQAEFLQIMTHLPEPVLERQVDEMFATVDTDQDGRISYQEFCVSIITLLSRSPLIHMK